MLGSLHFSRSRSFILHHVENFGLRATQDCQVDPDFLLQSR